MLHIFLLQYFFIVIALSSSSSSSSSSSEENHSYNHPNYLRESRSDEDENCFKHVFGTCKEDNEWKTAPFMCWKQVKVFKIKCLNLNKNIFSISRELDNKPMDFKDAIKHGLKLAVQENNPSIKLMPVGKLRKFDRVFGYDSRPFRQRNANFRCHMSLVCSFDFPINHN